MGSLALALDREAAARDAAVDRMLGASPHRGRPSGHGGIGGFVYRNFRHPQLWGKYIYGDLCTGDIRSLDPNAAQPSATDASTGLQVPMLSSFGEAQGGARCGATGRRSSASSCWRARCPPGRCPACPAC